MRRSSIVLAMVALGVAASARAQVVTPFAARYETTGFGNVAIAANTVLTCPSSSGTCAGARAGTTPPLLNNSYAMTYVDVDGDAATFNSSEATLAIPPGASVLWAGLYWGADTTAGTGGVAAPNAAASNTVRLTTPGGSGLVTGAVLGTSTASGSDYHAFADVTATVQAAGPGTYTVANVQAGTGNNRHGGWALVVVYEDPGEPARNMVVYDGFAQVTNAGSTVSIPVSGFVTPTSGPVRTQLGVVAYEGDRSTTGDSLQLNATVLSDAVKPANDFFNSTISRGGVDITTKNPDYQNQLGFDAIVVDATDVLANGATSATISLTTTGDFYYPGVVVFITEVFAPNLAATLSKSVADLNGGTVRPGDVLEYTIATTNTGQDDAAQVVLTDPLPAGVTFVPGSLEIASGANAGTKTDAALDDQAEYDSGANRVVFRLGTGASGAAGGVIPNGGRRPGPLPRHRRRRPVRDRHLERGDGRLRGRDVPRAVHGHLRPGERDGREPEPHHRRRGERGPRSGDGHDDGAERARGRRRRRGRARLHLDGERAGRGDLRAERDERRQGEHGHVRGGRDLRAHGDGHRRRRGERDERGDGGRGADPDGDRGESAFGDGRPERHAELHGHGDRSVRRADPVAPRRVVRRRGRYDRRERSLHGRVGGRRAVHGHGDVCRPERYRDGDGGERAAHGGRRRERGAGDGDGHDGVGPRRRRRRRRGPQLHLERQRPGGGGLRPERDQRRESDGGHLQRRRDLRADGDHHGRRRPDGHEQHHGDRPADRDDDRRHPGRRQHRPARHTGLHRDRQRSIR